MIARLATAVVFSLSAIPAYPAAVIGDGLPKASPESVRRVVARLFEQKRLVRRGKTRGTKYSLAPKA